MLPEHGSMQQFADYVGIQARYIGHIERKMKRIGRNVGVQLETVFGPDAGWLDVDWQNGTLAFDPDARDFAELAMRLSLKDRNQRHP